MPNFHVHVRRTEDITFAIDAIDAEDAEKRYLAEGDEIASNTSGLDIIDTEEAPA